MMKNGQSLVELLMTIAIVSIILPALLTGFYATRGGRATQDQRQHATAYLYQAEEAVRVVDANGWSNLSNGTYHPIISGNSWSLASGQELLDNNYTRKIIIGDVYRDGSGNIAQSGTLDPSSKLITTSVSWTNPIPLSVSAVSYLTRHKTLSHQETTVADFNAGTAIGATISATLGTGIPNDGQVQLGAGGNGDWCKPATSIVKTYDLPGQGVAQSISATSSATQDIAYTTTGDNASGDAVDGLTISYANPPVVSNPSSNNEAKAYGIFVDNAGSYVYFNENNSPNHTVRIANANNLSDVGYFDVSHTTGNSIYVLGNTGYTTAGSTLYSFDVSSKTGSRPQLGSVNLAGTGQKVFVVGTKAYVVTSSTTSQVQIINVSNPASMTVTKSINLGNSLGGIDIYVNGSQTYAYVVTSYSSGKNDFFIVDLNNTNNIYGYSTNGMNPKGITIVPVNRAILVGSGGILYQVFDITTPSAASYCGGMSPSGVTTISAVAPIIQNDGGAFSYIITNNSSSEFQVIEGGPGGQFSTSGTFTSTPYATSSSTFNYFSATVNQPSQTTITLQVSSASKVNNSCTAASYTYIGPDGTSNTFFTPNGNIISGQIPLSGSGTYINPSQCFRYKVNFSTTDQTQSPILYDMSVNYSP